MPDFFDRLLARSLPDHPLPQDETMVRPRLPQLFEKSTVDIEEQEFVTTSVRPAPVVTLPRSSPAVAANGGQPDQVPRVGAPVAQPAEPLSRPAATPVVTSQVPVSAPFSTPTQPPRSAGPVPPLSPVTEQPTTINVTVAAGQPTGTLLPVAASPAPATSMGAEQPRPTAPVVRRREPAQRQQVVRVTIGRLEVTAAGPDRQIPSRPNPSRPEPTVSLERYLAREDGRR